MRSVDVRVEVLAAATAIALALGGCFTGPAPEPDSTAGPGMALSATSLDFTSASGADPAAQTVTVSNAGAGTLAPPVPTTTYLGQEKDWLSVTVSGSAAPYTITVQPIVAGLPPRPSPNLATLSIDSPGAWNTPLQIAVQLTVK
jgi:hypothetical protein